MMNSNIILDIKKRIKMKQLIPLSLIILFVASCNSKSAEERAAKQLNAEHEHYDNILKDKLGFTHFIVDRSTNKENPRTEEKIKLGQSLYFDKRLSKDGNISCNSCHNLKTYGVDNLATSPGDEGKFGDRNSPTVLNASKHKMQFWDGRAKDVEEQAGMPIMNPIEMAIPSKEFLTSRLKEIEKYQSLFKAAYPNDSNPINYTNLEKAIAVFERELNTISPFDEYLKGDSKALTIDQKKGAILFVDNNCTSCHNGTLLGGKQLQKFGVFKDYWTLT